MTLLSIHLTDTLNSSDSGNKRPTRLGMAARTSLAANYIVASLLSSVYEGAGVKSKEIIPSFKLEVAISKRTSGLTSSSSQDMLAYPQGTGRQHAQIPHVIIIYYNSRICTINSTQFGMRTGSGKVGPDVRALAQPCTFIHNWVVAAPVEKRHQRADRSSLAVRLEHLSSNKCPPGDQPETSTPTRRAMRINVVCDGTACASRLHGVASQVLAATVRIRGFGSSNNWRSTKFVMATSGKRTWFLCIQLDVSTRAARSAASHHMQRSACGGGARRYVGDKVLQSR